MKKLSSMVVARWARDMGISGAEAERRIENGTPEFRMVVLRWYRSAISGDYIADLLDDPGMAEINLMSSLLDYERSTGTGAFSNRQADPREDDAERSAETLERIARAAANYRQHTNRKRKF